MQKNTVYQWSRGVVVINVFPNSEAFDAGIQEGDLITIVGTEKIKSKREFKSQLKKAKKTGFSSFISHPG